MYTPIISSLIGLPKTRQDARTALVAAEASSAVPSSVPAFINAN